MNPRISPDIGEWYQRLPDFFVGLRIVGLQAFVLQSREKEEEW